MLIASHVLYVDIGNGTKRCEWSAVKCNQRHRASVIAETTETTKHQVSVTAETKKRHNIGRQSQLKQLNATTSGVSHCWNNETTQHRASVSAETMKRHNIGRQSQLKQLNDTTSGVSHSWNHWNIKTSGVSHSWNHWKIKTLDVSHSWNNETTHRASVIAETMKRENIGCELQLKPVKLSETGKTM